MTKMKLLAAAAVVSGLIATPVMAKDPMNRRAQATQEYRASTVDSGYRDSGFWPGDVAAGVVGGAVGVAGAAVGAAGAIATAPFRNSYNSYDGYNGVPRDSYAQRMGFVCQPGTWFRGEDGRRHICQ
ncbi:hypothetical protein AB7813_17655 [Tardiphaga sp. 20_F10_N6_6]|jgi:hypothetical protein|uniref:hypothetical protein n=1 Tax=Tardiphaga TaxID=1395974 RepID=UPI002866B7FB|nr:hypothetical protein [Tardiphaga robiniae]MDR6658526.1 hypothetical protein [Tardiphaga robiniae]